MRWEYMGLPGVTENYKGLQGVPRGDRGFARGYGGLQWIIETFF